MDYLDECNEKMNKSLEALKESLGTLRAGRVSAGLLDKVTANVYGSVSPIKYSANVSVLSPTDLSVKPYDPGTLKDILSGINKADLGCTVTQNGTLTFNAVVTDYAGDITYSWKSLYQKGNFSGNKTSDTVTYNANSFGSDTIQVSFVLGEETYTDTIDVFVKADHTNWTAISTAADFKTNLLAETTVSGNFYLTADIDLGGEVINLITKLKVTQLINMPMVACLVAWMLVLFLPISVLKVLSSARKVLAGVLLASLLTLLAPQKTAKLTSLIPLMVLP